MSFFIALDQIDDCGEGNSLSRIVVGLLLLESQQEVLGQHEPPPTQIDGYLRQVLRKRDYFSRKLSKAIEVSSCFRDLEVRGIRDYYLVIGYSVQLQQQAHQRMGNMQCCEHEKNADFKDQKADKNNSQKPAIKEVSVNPNPKLIKHDKIQTLQPTHQHKSLSQHPTTHQQNNQNPDKDKNSQKSQSSLIRIKAVESLNEINSLQAPQQPQENQYLTESKVREYERHQRQSKTVMVPQLNPKVRSTLQKYQFFKSEFKFQPRTMAYGNEVYQGQLEMQKEMQVPCGYGKMYKADGSLFIGQFLKGKAHGMGAYIFPDGSFYQGEFAKNLAHDENGFFKALNYEYRGGFKNNAFEGKGTEITENHIFEGFFSNGNKITGILRWDDAAYEYKGPFELDKFHGKGILVEPTGTYEGDFYYGMKHGEGQYHYTNGLRYEGEYKNNKREGKGALYNPGKTYPAYQGQFQDGMPHGQGFVYDDIGNKVASKWIMGLDSQCL